jgi:hypothetical protein
MSSPGNPMSRALDVAAFGWDRPWPGLYPDDLPPEWRLDYYSNEFRALLVPYSSWCDADEACWQEWEEELPPQFRLYWELPAASPGAIAALEQRCARLDGRCGGVVVAGEGAISLSTTLPWVHFSGGAGCYQGEGMGLLWLDGCPPLAQLRGQLEALLANTPGGASLVVVDGAPPDSRCLREATILADMLS